MENDGLGDSKHAASLPQDEDSVDLVSGSTAYGSMPALPSTLEVTGCRSLVFPKTSAWGRESSKLDEMEQDDQVMTADAVDLPMAIGGACNLEGNGLQDSRHASPTDGFGPHDPLLIDQHGTYLWLGEVGHDVRYLVV